MKRFLLKTLLFLLPLIILTIGIEFLIRNIPNDYSTKKSYIQKHGSEIDVLVLGSSHVYHGVNPEFFSKKCFNLAHIAQTPEFDLKLFQKYISKMDHLKVLLYPISYFSFFYDLQTSPEAWRLKNYTIYYQLDAAQSIQDYSELLALKPKLNYQRIVDFYLKKRSEVGVTPLGWGFNCLAEYSQNLEESALVSAQRHTLPSHQFYYKNSKEVEQILEICKAKGIKLILFTPPASEPYRNAIDPKQLQITYSKIDSLLIQYNNSYFIDYFADTTFTRQDFLDADHLNDLGALGNFPKN